MALKSFMKCDILNVSFMLWFATTFIRPKNKGYGQERLETSPAIKFGKNDKTKRKLILTL